MIIDLTEIGTIDKQNWLQGAVAPRPIGLISTIDADGVPNLAPFSFFNIVSSDPPILIFSPSRRLRNNTAKHTVLNIREVPEAVVHIVGYENLRQMNLCACEYPEAVDEFVKSGFTKEKAHHVKPFLINECAVKFECRIKHMQSMGDKGGSGMVCFAEVICMHVDERVLDQHGRIDPLQLQPVARLGGDYYTRITTQNLFTMPKPNVHLGIGFDSLPKHILRSTVLTANHLGQLALVQKLPSIDPSFMNIAMRFELENPVSETRTQELHCIAKRMLDLGMVEEAWQVLLREEVVLEPDEALIVLDRVD